MAKPSAGGRQSNVHAAAALRAISEAHSALENAAAAISRSSRNQSPLEKAHDLLAESRHRTELLPEGFLSEPRWQMLLTIFIAAEEGRELRPPAAYKDSNVADSTGRRIIEELVSLGLVALQLRAAATRKQQVVLAPAGREIVMRALAVR